MRIPGALEDKRQVRDFLQEECERTIRSEQVYVKLVGLNFWKCLPFLLGQSPSTIVSFKSTKFLHRTILQNSFSL
jgi:hypothetical protein